MQFYLLRSECHPLFVLVCPVHLRQGFTMEPWTQVCSHPPPTSTSQVGGLQVCATIPSSAHLFTELPCLPDLPQLHRALARPRSH